MRACRDCEWGVVAPAKLWRSPITRTVRLHWWSLRKNFTVGTGEYPEGATPERIICKRFWPRSAYPGFDVEPDHFCYQFERRS